MRLTPVLALTVMAIGLLLSACGSDSDSARASHPATSPFACPPKSLGEGRIASLNENPKSREAIVPGEPDRLLICRYLGLNHGARSNALLRWRSLADPSVVRSIAGEFDALPPFPKGVFACPNDDGSRTYALFHYGAEPTVVVEVAFTGCWAASNGRAEVVVPSAHLRRLLVNLTKRAPDRL